MDICLPHHEAAFMKKLMNTKNLECNFCPGLPECERTFYRATVTETKVDDAEEWCGKFL